MSSVKKVELSCRDLAEIRAGLAEIDDINIRGAFTNEELAEARSFLMEQGIISPSVQSFSSRSLNNFMSRLDMVQRDIPGSCESFSKSIILTIEQRRDRFMMQGFSFVEPGIEGQHGLKPEDLDLIGAASMVSGVEDLFGSVFIVDPDSEERAPQTRQIPSVIIMNERFPSEREGELWKMVGRAYDALGRAERAMDAGQGGQARAELSQALEVVAGMGVTPGLIDDLWARHPGLALDARKLAIRAADLLHALGDDEAAFEMMAGNIAVSYGRVSLAYDYSFSRGFEYPPPKATSPECSYDRRSKSWAENTYQKLTDQLAGKIRCYDAVGSGGR